jgi:hypothetical protein
MNAGDTLALCRGGAWDENGGQIHNERCRATNDSTYCDYRDYTPPWGSVAANEPRINAGANHAFAIWHSDAAYQGYRFWNLDIRHRGGESRGFFIINRQSDIDLCNVAVRDALIGVEIAPRGPHHITIRNSAFENNVGHAILSGAPHVTIDSSSFINNGDQNHEPAKGGQLHTIYTACNDAAHPCPGVRITNNYVRTDPDGAWGVCGGMMLIFRGWLPGLLVENNIVVGHGDYGCGGIAPAGSSAYTEIHDAIFRRNRIYWGRGSGLPMFVSACVNCVVEDNVVDSGSRHPAIQVPERTHADVQTNAVTTGVIVRNNTIRAWGGGPGLIVGRGEGRDFIVENNAVWVPTGGRCFSVTSPTAVGHSFTVSFYPSAAPNTAGNYCSATSSASPTLMWADPANADYTVRNYKPTNPGPLIGMANQEYYSRTAIGTIEWSPTDPGLARRPPVDIGAYQR